MLNVSLEAIEDLAARARATHVQAIRAALEGRAEAPQSPLDTARLARAYALARATDPALGVLVAEVVAFEALRRPARAYEAAWAAHPIVLPGERPVPGAPRALVPLLALEPNEHRRAAVARVADALAKDRLPEARELVDALRAAGGALGLDVPTALHAALGHGDPADVLAASDGVLTATEEAFRELEAWVRPRVGLGRAGELAWSDRVRTLAVARASELVPMGDRAGIASRWIARVGLGEPLARVRDDTARAQAGGAGVRALAERPGERALVAGTPTTSARGAVSLAGAVLEALAMAFAPAPPGEANSARVAPRLGVDRVHHAVAHALGRRLFIEGAFVTREAGVDRGAREPVLLELLHAELLATRVDAALARFVLDTLAREGDLPARLREYLARATLGTAPPPAWAAHLAAHALELRPGAHTLASLIEPRVRDVLREKHDDDWFRNPRSGETLASLLDALRTRGAVAWAAHHAGEDGRATDAAPLARRAADALRDARR